MGYDGDRVRDVSTLLQFHARTHTPKVTRVQVGSTSQKLSALLMLESWCTTITLRPYEAGICVDDGVASADSMPLGMDTLVLHGPPAKLGELQFWAATGTYLFVVQEG